MHNIYIKTLSSAIQQHFQKSLQTINTLNHDNVLACLFITVKPTNIFLFDEFKSLLANIDLKPITCKSLFLESFKREKSCKLKICEFVCN